MRRTVNDNQRIKNPLPGRLNGFHCSSQSGLAAGFFVWILKMNKKFKIPAPDEVTAYAASIGYELEGDAFCDFYASKGWMVGRNKMKDWQAAVRTWKRRHDAANPNPIHAATRETPEEELDALLGVNNDN